MTLIEQINIDFITAYKAKEMVKKDFLGVLKSEVSRETKVPSDDVVISKIKSMIKNAEATKSLTDYELNILSNYLPSQMTEQALTLVITTCISTNNYSEMKDMGKVMGWLKSNYNGKYDGKTASNIIKSILTNG
tara:strand:+ start:848 stop:1249 length:402 start_codon:yes stop_codon:yes gene_type:complete